MFLMLYLIYTRAITVEQFFSPWANPERFWVRPGNVPEGNDRGGRQRLANHPGQQRKVVILNQYDGVWGLGFLHHGASKCAIDLRVLFPVGGPECRSHMCNVTEWL